MRLPHKRRCCVADTVTRHITKALSSDGKRMGSNGNIAQWCHNHGAHYLRTAHQDILYGYRDTYLAGVPYIFLYPSERYPILTEIEQTVSECRKIEIGQRDTDIRQSRTHRCSHHTHLHNINEEIIESHVTQAYQYSHDAGRMHIACRLEHHLGNMIQEHKRQY